VVRQTPQAIQLMTAYYNEFNPHAAAWLRKLIAADLIAPGDVDERSIADVRADDLAGYAQCHFFAGIGGWSVALRLAGVPDTARVWTGSPPCQPYSVASVAHGGAQGQGDHRHLAPVFVGLIRERRPAKVYGEQVASAIRWGWWDELALALEREGYAVAAAVLRADAVEADHQRKRLYWVADAGREGREGHQPILRLPVSAQAALAKYGNPLAGARRALDGDYSHLLPCDGLSVRLERDAAHGYGNAIVPQSAQVFIEAVTELAA
jgi:DNA (cytosine-5)-methyltransferase 1